MTYKKEFAAQKLNQIKTRGHGKKIKNEFGCGQCSKSIFNPTGEWTSQHQMRANGKRDQFEMEDLVELSKKADLKRDRAIKILENITNVFKKWDEYAEKAGVFDHLKNEIRKNLRTDLYVKKLITSKKNRD